MRFSCSRTTILASALFTTSLLACSDDGGSEVGDEAETSTTGDGTTDDDADESGDSGSSEGNDAETTNTDAETTNTDAETTDAETTDADTSETKGTEEETTDTGNLGCGEADNFDACEAIPGCQPVLGQLLEGGGLGSSPCLAMPEFLDCIPEQACDDALTWFCDGQEMYLVPNSCGPDGFEMCGGPPNIPMDCK